MHSDVQPAWPLSCANPLLGAIPTRTLHEVCVLSGAAALVLFGLRLAAVLVWLRLDNETESPG
jgi:hypothetical protein